jgi:hypothetical protein
MAAEITMTFLEKNTFHFQDARLGMREFLNTPFPCGHKPRDYVRDIVICLRCEGPVNQHDRYMWGDEEDYDGVWGSLQEFPWKEDGLYYNLRCQNWRISFGSLSLSLPNSLHHAANVLITTTMWTYLASNSISWKSYCQPIAT